VAERTTQVSGLDPAAALAVLKLEVVEGDLTSLDDGRLAVSTEVRSSWTCRSATTSRPPGPRPAGRAGARGGVRAERVPHRAAVSEQRLLRQHVGRAAAGGRGDRAEGVSPEDARRAPSTQPSPTCPTITVEDQAEFVADQRSQIDQLLNIVLVLLVLSILIAVLGIVNTLALSVVERTRELGLLRRGPAATSSCGG
jgi:putative ABC transport system permease protein